MILRDAVASDSTFKGASSPNDSSKPMLKEILEEINGRVDSENSLFIEPIGLLLSRSIAACEPVMDDIMITFRKWISKDELKPF